MSRDVVDMRAGAEEGTELLRAFSMNGTEEEGPWRYEWRREMPTALRCYPATDSCSGCRLGKEWQSHQYSTNRWRGTVRR